MAGVTFMELGLAVLKNVRNGARKSTISRLLALNEFETASCLEVLVGNKLILPDERGYYRLTTGGRSVMRSFELLARVGMSLEDAARGARFTEDGYADWNTRALSRRMRGIISK